MISPRAFLSMIMVATLVLLFSSASQATTSDPSKNYTGTSVNCQKIISDAGKVLLSSASSSLLDLKRELHPESKYHFDKLLGAYQLGMNNEYFYVLIRGDIRDAEAFVSLVKNVGYQSELVSMHASYDAIAFQYRVRTRAGASVLALDQLRASQLIWAADTGPLQTLPQVFRIRLPEHRTFSSNEIVEAEVVKVSENIEDSEFRSLVSGIIQQGPSIELTVRQNGWMARGRYSEILQIASLADISVISIKEALGTEWDDPIMTTYTMASTHYSHFAPRMEIIFAKDKNPLPMQEANPGSMHFLGGMNNVDEAVLDTGSKVFILKFIPMVTGSLVGPRHVIDSQEITFTQKMESLALFFAGTKWMLINNEKTNAPRVLIDLEAKKAVAEWDEDGMSIMGPSPIKLEDIDGWELPNAHRRWKFNTPGTAAASKPSADFLEVQLVKLGIFDATPQFLKIKGFPGPLANFRFLQIDNLDKAIPAAEKTRLLLWSSDSVYLFNEPADLATEHQHLASLVVKSDQAIWNFKPEGFSIGQILISEDKAFALLLSNTGLNPEVIIDLKSGKIAEFDKGQTPKNWNLGGTEERAELR